MALAIADRPFAAVFAAAEKQDLVLGNIESDRAEVGTLMAAVAKGLVVAEPTTAPPQGLPGVNSGGQG